LRDAYGQALGRVVLLRDVTGEHELRQLRSDLTHMLIHDLSNPLSAMQMAIELVQLRQDTPGGPITAGEDAPDAVDIIRRSNLRAQRLVSGLLDVNRLESGVMQLDPEPVDAHALARGLQRELSAWAGERELSLTVVAAPRLPHVLADGDLLDRVLRNLLGNAIKFTPPGGAIGLAMAPEDGLVRFSVRDTGPGIPPAVQARLFEKFVRGSGPQRGHGLGLAFCKLAVETMGGRIWADGAGPGATLCFTLPAVPPPPPDPADD
jgi:signal transduction histidine kinase